MEPSPDTWSCSATSAAATARSSPSSASAPPPSPPEPAGRPAPRLSFGRFLLHVPGLLRDRAEEIRRIAERHGPIVRVPVPGKPFYLLSCPRHARRVLLTNNKNYRRSFDWRIVRSFFGDGLVTSHDAVWRHGRACARPAFRAEAAERALASLAEVVVEEVEGWDREGQVVAVGAATTRVALRAFTRAVLRVDADADLEAIARDVLIGLRHLDRRLAALVDVHEVLPTLSRLRFERARRRLDGVIYRWIDELPADAPGEGLLAVLAGAARAGVPEGLDPRRWLRDQVATYLMAGHETVASSLTWALHLLAAHPDVQARAREEVRSADGVAGLPYLVAVVREALRLFPPVWSIGRETLGEDRFDGAVVPAGATVMVSPYAIHRRADLWPEPDAFRPERFLGGAVAEAGLAYLPFGAGPRACIGERMALHELHLTLREVLRRYEVSLVDAGPVPREALISLRPRRELHLRFARR